MKRLSALLGAGALVLTLASTAFAGDNFATVSGHAASTSENNNPLFWGEDCTKLDAGEGDLGGSSATYELTANYTKVIVKAGSGQSAGDNALTIFDNPTAGQLVFADTNGNNVSDPGGQDGDKNISHIIFCGPGEETEAPSFEQSQEGETDAPSDAPSFEQSQEGATEPSTDAFGTNGTSGPADGAWLLVVALGVLLGSVVVLTPARAKSRR